VATAARSARDVARGRATARAGTFDFAIVEAPFMPPTGGNSEPPR
jgi:hypothetical protein